MKKRARMVVVMAIAGFIFSFNAYAADVQIHGFLGQGYFVTENNNFLDQNSKDGTFDFNEFGVNFTSRLNDKLRLGLQLVSKDMGDYDNNTVKLDWAYGDYRFKDWLGVRAGLVKQPVGLFAQTWDQDFLRTPIFLPTDLYGEGRYRDLLDNFYGGELYGMVSMGNAGNLDYEAYVGNQFDENVNMATYLRNQEIMDVKNVQTTDAYGGRLFYDSPFGLRAGATAMHFNVKYEGSLLINSFKDIDPLLAPLLVGAPGKSTSDYWIFIYSLEYAYKNLQLASEYHMVTWKQTNELGPVDLDGPSGPIPPIHSTTDIYGKTVGYYFMGSYRFTKLLSLGAYYDVYYPDANDMDGEKLKDAGLKDYGAWQKDTCATIRLDLNENWLVKAEGHWVDGTGNVFAYQNPDGMDQDWEMYAVKLTYYF
jgi:hypothetical protein